MANENEMVETLTKNIAQLEADIQAMSHWYNNKYQVELQALMEKEDYLGVKNLDVKRDCCYDLIQKKQEEKKQLTKQKEEICKDPTKAYLNDAEAAEIMVRSAGTSSIRVDSTKGDAPELKFNDKRK
jgi:hypothetical protein